MENEKKGTSPTQKSSTLEIGEVNSEHRMLIISSSDQFTFR